MSKFHATEFDFLPQLAFRPRPGGGMTLEGGKGDRAPPPDPRLVEAQVHSMGVQDDMMQRIIKNSDEMLPLQKQQLQLGLQSAERAYGESADDRKFALGRRDELVRAQQPMLDEANNFNEGTRRGQMMHEAEADIGAGFSTARGQQQRALQRSGVNPNAGRSLVLRNQMDTGEALARATAGRRVSEAAKAEGLSLRSNAANMLSGYPSMASGLTGQGFGFGTAGLGLTGQGLAGMNSGYGAGAGVAGQLGSNATGMFGAQATYKSAQDKINADSDPFNTILGAATAVGTKALLASDRRLKTDIEPIGWMENGLPVYRYRYKAGGPFVVGVMADDVARIAPAAYLRGGAGNGYDAVDYSKL